MEGEFEFMEMERRLENDFNSSNYRSTTGWDANSLYTDPGFYSAANGIYHITSNSPARDRGQDSSCATFDYDKEIRSNKCDIGMDEYTN